MIRGKNCVATPRAPLPVPRLHQDTTGEPVLLTGEDLPERPNDWSPDGKYLLYRVDDPENGRGLRYVPVLLIRPARGVSSFSSDVGPRNFP